MLGVYSGKVLENAQMYELTNEEINPHIINFTTTGNFLNGNIEIRIQNPSTFCVNSGTVDSNGNPIYNCGKDSQDVTFKIKSLLGQLSLVELVNNPSQFPQGQGLVANVTGTWIGAEFQMILSYSLRITRNLPNGLVLVVDVGNKSSFVGKINNNVFKGYNIGSSVPYRTINGNPSLLPYEVVVNYGEIDSSKGDNVFTAYRAISPGTSFC